MRSKRVSRRRRSNLTLITANIQLQPSNAISLRNIFKKRRGDFVYSELNVVALRCG
jgi:hypothetical protein